MLFDVAKHLPENLYKKALEVTQSIQVEHSQAFALGKFSEYWPDSWMPTLLEKSRNLKDGHSRAHAFSDLLLRLDPTEIDPPFWQELLATLTCRTRAEFFEDIPKLAPAIVALGGEDALREVVESMRQVCGWWP